MNILDEAIITCPYCGETISVLINQEDQGEEYIEDCQVCCRPITFGVEDKGNGGLLVSVYTDDDVTG